MEEIGGQVGRPTRQRETNARHERKVLAPATGFARVDGGWRREEDARAEDGIPEPSCFEGSVALTDRLLESCWKMEEGGDWKRVGWRKMLEQEMVFLARTASWDRWHLRTDFSRAVGGWRRRELEEEGRAEDAQAEDDLPEANCTRGSVALATDFPRVVGVI